MSDEKQYTETDLVKAKRQAFRDGAVHAARTHGCGRPECADERYPLPKITRPRVVKYKAHFFRVVDGRIQWSKPWWKRASAPESLETWHDVEGTHPSLVTVPSAELILILADLLANPTEEVEAES